MTDQISICDECGAEIVGNEEHTCNEDQDVFFDLGGRR